MPYVICKVDGGYKVKKEACGCRCAGGFMSKKALTRDTAEKQKKAIEISESTKNVMSKSMMDRLKQHSKAHTGGMNGKHMKNMVRFVKNGDSFSTAHKKAKKLDKKM